MKTYRAIRYEIAPTATQREILRRMLGCTRFVWNKLLALSVTRYESEKKFIISVPELNSTLNCLKRDFGFLCEAPSQALQQVFLQQQKALRDFLTHRKTDHHFGFPKFHRKHNGDSFSIPVPCQVDFENWKVKLPKIGTVRIFKGSNKAIPVKQIKCYTVSYTPTGRFFISVVYCVNKEKMQGNGSTVGIDLGIKHYCVTSDGEIFENQKYLSRNLKRLRVMQRSLSRKYKVGKKREEQSNNWKKTMKKVCKLHEKIGFQRKDFLHKLSTYLAKRYYTVCAETLSVKNMVRNRKLSKVISDAGWGTFLSMLKYKCGTLVEIDRFYPSSQTCSGCGSINPKVRNLSVRNWVCPNCNTFHDRDLNAAKNILGEGLSLCGHKVSNRLCLPQEPHDFSRGSSQKDKLASLYPDQILKFEVPAANVRADAVLLTDPITAFEIKTERDTLERLENQVANYFKVFPQVVAVVHVSKAEKAVELLKNTCAGVWSANDDGGIEVIKKGSINTANIDHDAVFAFLRKYEHEHILRKYFGALPDSNDFERYSDWLELFRTLSKDTVIKEMWVACYLRWHNDRGKKDFFGLEN